MRSTTTVVLSLLALANWSQAGTIFTTRASYDAAVINLNLSWSEDFEAFAQGPVSLPTIIGAGAAEIAKTGTAAILPSGATLPPNGNNEWLGVEAGLGEVIQGLAATSLGVNAFGFDYFSELDGSYNFHHSGGVDSDVLMPSLTPLFVGWVGSPGELLDFVDYTPGTSAHILDDIVAHVVPEPSILLPSAISVPAVLLFKRRRAKSMAGECPLIIPR